MENVLGVAKYIIDKYFEVYNMEIDEIKLHKLLYFSQRENLAIKGKPLFFNSFYAWKYGPVCKKVRYEYKNKKFKSVYINLSRDCKYVLDNIVLKYGLNSSWELVNISHNEISWNNSKDKKNTIISIKDILQDAKNIRPYDTYWDMYYDEFEDSDDYDR